MASNLIGVYGSNPISALKRNLKAGDILTENLDQRLIQFLFPVDSRRFKRLVELVGNNRNPIYKSFYIKSIDVGFSYGRYENVNAAYFSLNNIETLDDLFRLLISFYRVTYTNYEHRDLELLSQYINNEHFYSHSMSIDNFQIKYIDQLPSNLHLYFKLEFHPSAPRERDSANPDIYDFNDLYDYDLDFDPLANPDDVNDFYLDRLERAQNEVEDYVEEQEFLNNLDNLSRYQEEDNSQLLSKGSGIVRDYQKFKRDVAASINQ